LFLYFSRKILQLYIVSLIECNRGHCILCILKHYTICPIMKRKNVNYTYNIIIKVKTHCKQLSWSVIELKVHNWIIRVSWVYNSNTLKFIFFCILFWRCDRSINSLNYATIIITNIIVPVWWAILVQLDIILSLLFDFRDRCVYGLFVIHVIRWRMSTTTYRGVSLCLVLEVESICRSVLFIVYIMMIAKVYGEWICGEQNYFTDNPPIIIIIIIITINYNCNSRALYVVIKNLDF